MYTFIMEINYKTLRASNVRDSSQDKMFGPKVIERRQNTVCMVDGCDKPLTSYSGPASTKLCREHQLLLREYGGNARVDRPYTFWKKDHCQECGHVPMRDNPKIAELEKPYDRILGMMMLDVDHIDKPNDPKLKYKLIKNGVNHPNNLITLCKECHQLKTYTKGDHWVKGFHDNE